MNAEEIRQLFDKVVVLSPGQFLRIACSGRGEQDSIRSQLYRERANYYNRNAGAEKNIDISRLTLKREENTIDGARHFVTIRVGSAVTKVALCDDRGVVENIHIASECPDELNLNPTQRRMLTLMLEDGIDEETAIETILAMPRENSDESIRDQG